VSANKTAFFCLACTVLCCPQQIPTQKRVFVFCPRDHGSTFSTRRSFCVPATRDQGPLSLCRLAKRKHLQSLHPPRLPVRHCRNSIRNTCTPPSPLGTRHRHQHLSHCDSLAGQRLTRIADNKQHHPRFPYPGAFQRTTLLDGPVSPKQPPRPSSCTTNNSTSSSKPCHIALQIPNTQGPAHLQPTPWTQPMPYRNNARTTHVAPQNPRLQSFCRAISPVRLLLDRPPAIATALHTRGHTCDRDLVVHHLLHHL
jgi:hypothetical protein